jgi:uncharacterized membrane protein YbhN (UPF0104 family)
MMPARAGRYLLGGFLLAIVLLVVNPASVAATLAGADLRLVGIAVVSLVAMHAVMGLGWRWMIAKRSGVRLTLGEALRAHYAAQAVGSVTPGNLGADVHRAAVLRRAGHGWAAAVEPILVQRATSYLALSLLAGAGLVILSSASEFSRPVVAFGAAVAVLLVAASWLVLRPGPRFAGMRNWLRNRFEGTASGGPDASAGTTWTLTLGGVANGLLFHAGSIGLTWLLVVAMNPSTPTWPMLAAIAVARLSLAIPISPSGLGVQEGTLAALVAGMQLAPQPALAAMLVARLSTLMLAAIGVMLIVMAPGGPKVGRLSETSAAESR